MDLAPKGAHADNLCPLWRPLEDSNSPVKAGEGVAIEVAPRAHLAPHDGLVITLLAEGSFDLGAEAKLVGIDVIRVFDHEERRHAATARDPPAMALSKLSANDLEIDAANPAALTEIDSRPLAQRSKAPMTQGRSDLPVADHMMTIGGRFDL